MTIIALTAIIRSMLQRGTAPGTGPMRATATMEAFKWLVYASTFSAMLRTVLVLGMCVILTLSASEVHVSLFSRFRLLPTLKTAVGRAANPGLVASTGSVVLPLLTIASVALDAAPEVSALLVLALTSRVNPLVVAPT